MSPLAIITGASRGIGAAAAQRFLDAGWDVLGLARGGCSVAGARSLSLDLLSEGWEGPLSEALEAAPRRIALVHNAALLEPDRSDALDPERFRRTLELNVVVPASLNRLIVPRMAPGSSVLYVGSTLSEKAVAGVASYVVSKHAVAGLMRATCQDLAGREVHTVCVCPGFTATEMLLTRAGEDPGVLEALASLSTFGRLIEPDEIARVLLFCAENPVVNGAVLHANLGQVER